MRINIDTYLSLHDSTLLSVDDDARGGKLTLRLEVMDYYASGLSDYDIRRGELIFTGVRERYTLPEEAIAQDLPAAVGAGEVLVFDIELTRRSARLLICYDDADRQQRCFELFVGASGVEWAWEDDYEPTDPGQRLLVLASAAVRDFRDDDLSDARLSSQINELLFGEKEIFPCLEDEIITPREAANALLANLITFALHAREDDFYPAHQEVSDTLVAAVEQALVAMTRERAASSD